VTGPDPNPTAGSEAGRYWAHESRYDLGMKTGTVATESTLDVLGLTFAELCSARRPRQHEVRPLRAAYKAALRGAPSDGRLRADVLPVVRHVQEGELIKFVQRTATGLEIESVLVPMCGRWRTWQTLCVSSQIGCARGCAFCETGQLGLLRNLTAGEIVGQVVAAQRDFGRVRNVVFMGMGEPFDNFDAVIQAVRVLNDRSGLSFSHERIALSTVGRVAGIGKLAALGWRRINLAVSLNAPSDEIRTRLMPINRLEPMAALRDALLAYPLRNCQYFMIEYVLIPGVNDAPEHARELADYLRPLRSVVNVIPYNPRRDSPWPAPSEEAIARFLAALDETGQTCKRRITKGREHMAACGQLGSRDLIRREPVRLTPL
jgi:23S rRNA (adenine2503-C2)-methyltransferase